MSHKYQLSRLRLWCEHKLYQSLKVDNVCMVLCQAHLYEAARLEEACLKFIKSNEEQIVVSPSFCALFKDWPHVMLKISVFMAGVPESKAAAAIESQRQPMPCGGKRKRD